MPESAGEDDDHYSARETFRNPPACRFLPHLHHVSLGLLAAAQPCVVEMRRRQDGRGSYGGSI